jgi:hypothetical protein
MQNEQELTRKEAGEDKRNMIDFLPAEIIFYICSFLDIQWILNLGRTSKHFSNLVGAYHSKFKPRELEWIFPMACKEFIQIFHRAPRLAGDVRGEKNDQFNISQLQKFNSVIQLILEAVNENRDDNSSLNIVSGEELLRSVGRLSMMIDPAGFLPVNETFPLPLNWTTQNYLEDRKHDYGDIKVSDILVKLEQAKPGLLVEGTKIKTGDYEEEGTKRLRKTLSEKAASISPVLFNLLPWLDAKSIRSLASTNKTFLMLIGFTSPNSLSADEERKRLIAELAVRAALLIKDKVDQLTGDPDWAALSWFGEGKHFDEEMVSAFTEELEQMASLLSQNPTRYGMRLPWGNNHIVNLINQGSVRMIFSQGLEIIKMIESGKSKADDLSYERIVKYLKTRSKDEIERQVRNAFLNLKDVNEAFVGELVILLVGIEGSQNNFTILHAPMITDLVCKGKIQWDDALFKGHRMGEIPYFAMAADKNQKGILPLVRHGNVMTSGKIEDDGKGNYDKFQRFLRREFDLHKLFFETFCPELDDYESNDQLNLSMLIVKNYLLSVFFMDLESEAVTRVNKSILSKLLSQ